MRSTSEVSDLILFDAGMFISALLRDDPRHNEAYPLVEAARCGEIPVCTTSGILSEVYAALTWEKAQPQHKPEDAAEAVQLLVASPSAIQVLDDGLNVTLRSLELASIHRLRARRIHDARHAATALVAGVFSVYTYDIEDWKIFHTDGLQIAGPVSILSSLKNKEKPKQEK